MREQVNKSTFKSREVIVHEFEITKITFQMWRFAFVVVKAHIYDRLPTTLEKCLGLVDILKACAVRLSETTILLIRCQLIHLKKISKLHHEKKSMPLV